MRFWIIFGLILSALTTPASQTGLDVYDLGVDYQFGQKITFRAQVQSAEQVKEVYVLYQPEGQDSIVRRMAFNQDGLATLQVDLSQSPIRPFVNISYWYQVKTVADSVVDSWKYQFLYEDNRFEWQQLDGNRLEIRWTEGDLAFGQSILDTARAGISSAQQYLDIQPPPLIRVYVYPTSTDLQNALQLVQLPWVGGHASPDLATILISIPPAPESKMVMEAKIPHEVMHILQYQKTGSNYVNLPAWLAEGMATLAEIYPNTYYQISLDEAAKKDNLLPIRFLCSAFPPETSSAHLAYAQSVSFTRYLYKNYGRSGVESLIQTYNDGMGCEEGVEKALGINLERLEYNWRLESLGMNTAALALRNLVPYFVVFGALLVVPILFSLGRSRNKKAE